MMEAREYARQLVGKVLYLPAITGTTSRPETHLKIIRIVVDRAGPRRVASTAFASHPTAASPRDARSY